jgi:ElaB/YqjD/DUF883 family membrane-anchored ribosome-binding protein
MSTRSETLNKDIDELRAAVEKLTGDVSEIGKAMAGDARDAAGRKAREIGESGRKAAGAVEDTVRERPVQSLAVAFGAGLLLAGLLRRR